MSVTRKNRVNKDCLNQTVSHERRRLRRIYPRSLNETWRFSRAGRIHARSSVSSHFIHTNTARIRDTRQSDAQPRYFPLLPHPRQLDTSNKGFPYFYGLIVCQRGRREVAAGRNSFEKKGVEKESIPSVTSDGVTLTPDWLLPTPRRPDGVLRTASVQRMCQSCPNCLPDKKRRHRYVPCTLRRNRDYDDEGPSWFRIDFHVRIHGYHC